METNLIRYLHVYDFLVAIHQDIHDAKYLFIIYDDKFPNDIPTVGSDRFNNEFDCFLMAMKVVIKILKKLEKTNNKKERENNAIIQR